MLWYSLEAPRRGASNEYPQHMFSLWNKKNIDSFLVEKKRLIKSYTVWCLVLFVALVCLVAPVQHFDDLVGK